jgi:hypothetical protein
MNCGRPIKVSRRSLIRTIRLVIFVVSLIIGVLIAAYQMAKPYLPSEYQFPVVEQTETPTDESTDTPTDEPTETPTDEPTETEEPVVESTAISKITELVNSGICNRESTSTDFLDNSEFPNLTSEDWDQGYVRQCQLDTSATAVHHWVTVFGPELMQEYGTAMEVPVNTILITGPDWVIRSNYYGKGNPKTSTDTVVKGILNKFGGTYTLH